MIRRLRSLMAAAALAAFAGSMMAAPATADAEDAEPGDGPQVDEDSLADLVADAQRMLGLRGYDAGPVDGQFGLRTQRAIRAYQDLARERGYLEALKGPPPSTTQGDAAGRELVGMDPVAPSRAQ